MVPDEWYTEWVDFFTGQCQALETLWQGMYDDHVKQLGRQTKERHVDVWIDGGTPVSMTRDRKYNSNFSVLSGEN